MSERTRALVVVDLQNEFLSSGRFAILKSSKDDLLANLSRLLPDFRKVGHIIWIKSIYDNAAGNAAGENAGQVDFDTLHASEGSREAYLAGTHRGKYRCCPEGSVNAELYPEVAAQVSEDDTIIIKTYFSAFTKTSLLGTLQGKGVKRRFHLWLIPGFTIYVVQDCLGWGNEKSHMRAIQRMQELGVRVVDHQFATQENLDPPRLTVPELYYVNGSIPSWRVQIALYEKGIEVSQIRMKVMSYSKPTRLPFFLSLNHRGKTPVFIDMDEERTTINESLAILAYLETHYPHTFLLPPTAQRKSRARVLSLVQETENLHNAYDELEDAFFGARETNTTQDFHLNTRPRLLKALYKELKFWEKYASESEGFIAGGRGSITLADCAFYPLLGFMLRRGFEFDEQWKGLKTYHERMWERDSVRRAQPEGWDGRGKADIFKGT